MSSARQSKTTPQPAKSEIWLQSLGGREQRIGRGAPKPLYLLSLLLVAAVMLVLPVLYLALVALWGYSVYWFGVTVPGALKGVRTVWAWILLYLVPMVTGVVMVIFLIKPLFARHRQIHAPQVLRREDEPLLHAYVDKLCETVGAPKPAQIHIDMDLNASAGLKGAFSGLFGGKLVLTLGMPLVASLSLTQFTAVLAHEFGHFAQRGAMRLSYIIRSVNSWFARVVYQRDAWDEQLDYLAANGEHWIMVLVGNLAKLGVWISRRVLWCLMMLGHLVSMILMRQMEYDADRYSARTVGTEETSQMLRRMPMLGFAMEQMYNDLGRVFADRRLPSDVPALVANRVAGLSASNNSAAEKILADISMGGSSAKTGWFDTHPSMADRIHSLSARPEGGVFSQPGEARELFRDFPLLSRLMTQQYYIERLGEDAKTVKIVGVDDVEKERSDLTASADARDAIFAGTLDPSRADFPDLPWPAGDADAHAEELLVVREKLQRDAASVAKSIEVVDRAAAEEHRLNRLAALDRAGVKKGDIKRAGLEPAASPTDRPAAVVTPADLARHKEFVDRFARRAMRRILLALSMDPAEQLPAAPVEETYDIAEVPEKGPSRQLFDAAVALCDLLPECQYLERIYHQQESLLAFAETYGAQAAFVDEVVGNSNKLADRLLAMRKLVSNVTYTYSPEGKRVSLSQHLFPRVVAGSDIGETLQGVRLAVGNTYGLYMRLWADLARRASDFERELGLPDLAYQQAKTKSAKAK